MARLELSPVGNAISREEAIVIWQGRQHGILSPDILGLWW